MDYRNRKDSGRAEWVWEYRPQNAEVAAELSGQLHLSPLLAHVLAGRGLKNPDEVNTFLNPRLASLEEPSLLKDMDKATLRLKKALTHNEKICVYGDYDVDGITSTVLLLRFFHWLGKDADFYIPRRISEGYGLNRTAIEGIAQKGTKLLITVDNGISSVDEVAYANSLGMDVIVTDHHQSGAKLPPAVAVVNPNRKDAPYSATPLAGVGVAFKFADAATRVLDTPPDSAKRFLTSMLDLVALGTVADIVPLTGENRTFVKYGLERLQNTDKVGLKTLLQLAGAKDKTLTPDSISYHLAPRLNAAGRADKASLCVDLLLTEDNLRAIELTRQLNRLNNERRKFEADILTACLEFLKLNVAVEKQMVLVIPGEGWHIGVVGIVASRLLERFHRPVIVLAIDKDVARGSGRSIEGFDLYSALSACDEYLLAYGGHKRAAGLTLHARDVPRFTDAINEYAARIPDYQTHTRRLTIDAEVAAEDLSLNSLEALSALQPHGTANPSPIFSMRGVSLLEPPRIVGNNHLKLMLCQNGISLSAIGFSMADCFPELKDPGRSFRLAFKPFINEWRGYRNAELEIKDIKFE